MALDVYRITDRKKEIRLFRIDEKLMIPLEKVFEELKNTTGVAVDLYGDTRIYNNHLKIIMKSFSKLNLNKNMPNYNQLPSDAKSYNESSIGFLVCSV